MEGLLSQLSAALQSMVQPNVTPEAIAEADRWLFGFQKSPEAWTACHAVLTAPGFDDHLRFFAAQTIHAKLRCAFHELREEDAAALRDTLFQYCLSGGLSERVRMRVALCLVTLAVQMDSWTGIVEDIVGRLQGAPDVLAEVLRVLPEEADNHVVLVKPQRRNRVKDELEAAAPQALALVCSLQEQTPTDIRNKIVNCIAAWVRCCRIPAEAIAASPALPLCFASLGAPDVWDAAVDAVVEFLRRYDAHGPNMPAIQLLVPECMKLEALFDQAAPAMEEDDTAHDVVQGLTRIFTEMAESTLAMLLQEEDLNQVAVVGLVLKCTSLPDSDVAEITLNFWYHFLTQLHGIGDGGAKERLVYKYSGCIAQLVDTCLRLMAFPPNYEDLLEDGRELKRKFRHEIGATLDDCCRLTGAQHCLERAQAALAASVAQAQSGAVPPTQAWKAVEAALFAMRSLGYEAERDAAATGAVGAALEMLPTLPDALPQLGPHLADILYTSALVVGGYAGWIANHPSAVMPLFTFLLKCLPYGEAEAAAAQGVRALCKLCANELGADVISVYRQHGTALSVTSQALMLEGMSLVVAQMPLAQAVEAMRFLMDPVRAELEAALQVAQPDDAVVVLQLERAAALFHKAPRVQQQEQHPVVLFVTELQPALSRALDVFPSRVKVAENVCRVYKHAIRAAGPHFQTALPMVAEQLVRSFGATGQSPFLYCASVLVTDFGEYPDVAASLLGMVAAFSQTTFQVLTTLPAFAERPDLVEEYFYLIGRAVKHCVPSQWTPYLNLLVEAVKCGTVGLQVDHVDANRGVLYFLRQALQAAVPDSSNAPFHAVFGPVMGQLVAGAEGTELVRQLVGGATGGVPISRVVDDDDKHPDICKVLFELYEGFPSELRVAMQAALAAQDPGVVPPPLVELFMGDLFAERVDFYRFRRCVREFAQACRMNAERWSSG